MKSRRLAAAKLDGEDSARVGALLFERAASVPGPQGRTRTYNPSVNSYLTSSLFSDLSDLSYCEASTTDRSILLKGNSFQRDWRTRFQGGGCSRLPAIGKGTATDFNWCPHKSPHTLNRS